MKGPFWTSRWALEYSQTAFGMIEEHFSITAFLVTEIKPNARNKMALEIVPGETQDLSSLLEFILWKKSIYHSNDESSLDSKERPGKFIEVSENCAYAFSSIFSYGLVL